MSKVSAAETGSENWCEDIKISVYSGNRTRVHSTSSTPPPPLHHHHLYTTTTSTPPPALHHHQLYTTTSSTPPPPPWPNLWLVTRREKDVMDDWHFIGISSEFLFEILDKLLRNGSPGDRSKKNGTRTSNRRKSTRRLKDCSLGSKAVAHFISSHLIVFPFLQNQREKRQQMRHETNVT